MAASVLVPSFWVDMPRKVVNGGWPSYRKPKRHRRLHPRLRHPCTTSLNLAPDITKQDLCPCDDVCHAAAPHSLNWKNCIDDYCTRTWKNNRSIGVLASTHARPGEVYCSLCQYSLVNVYLYRRTKYTSLCAMNFSIAPSLVRMNGVLKVNDRLTWLLAARDHL